MSSVKIGIMSRGLNYRGSGIFTIISGFVQELLKTNYQNEVFLFTDPNQTFPFSSDNERIKIIPVSPGTNSTIGKFIWDHYSIGNACRKYNIDVLYSPSHIRPIYSPCPTVVQVLDMMYHKFPGYWNRFDRLYFQTIVSLLTPRASRISAISENTKRDIISILNIEENKIEVIYPGIPDGFKVVNKGESVRIREKLNLSKPYILFNGSFHPRKNLSSLVEAFEIIGNDIEHDLVIKVSRNWEDENLKQQIMNSSLSSRIKLFEAFFAINDLVYLYNEADIFVFPSLYEGFGFPVLEALACGCPTIASDISSIPEVTGDAGILVKPGDLNALSEAMLILLSKEEYRLKLKDSSLRQAKKFSWTVTTEKTIKLVLDAAGKSC
ncbi:MAG: glycosyltransferase family 4 protein [Promethearchaeota archaeon]